MSKLVLPGFIDVPAETLTKADVALHLLECGTSTNGFETGTQTKPTGLRVQRGRSSSKPIPIQPVLVPHRIPADEPPQGGVIHAMPCLMSDMNVSLQVSAPWVHWGSCAAGLRRAARPFLVRSHLHVKDPAPIVPCRGGEAERICGHVRRRPYDCRTMRLAPPPVAASGHDELSCRQLAF